MWKTKFAICARCWPPGLRQWREKQKRRGDAFALRKSASRTDSSCGELSRNGITFLSISHEVLWSAMRPRIAFSPARQFRLERIVDEI